MKIFIVGGAVRDQLLGLTPKDIDYLVTGATPEEMLALGYEQVGADFPVFLHPETKDEYALARIERKTGDGYHGFAVDFDPSVSVEDDLSRRDLTINAMAIDMETGEVIDPFHGRDDIENKVLRHVSDAFAEDPLRVVRLARFATRYSEFMIARETIELSRQMVKDGELNHLPDERFWAEMDKTLKSEPSGHFFYVLKFLGAFEHVDFFSNLFESKSFMRIGEAMKQVEHEDRLMFFTALTAKRDAKTMKSATMRTQKLFTNISRVRDIDSAGTAEIYACLSYARIWSQATDFDDLIKAMAIAESIDEEFFIDSKSLKIIGEATKHVSAEAYPGIEGKALGEAIANGRRNVIAVWREAIKTDPVAWGIV